jgi:1,4-dihydroxy-6-naphthoate synthase
MKLTLGFSPCPNDTFIFDALVNKKIDTGGLEFEPVLEDVQTLNEKASEGVLHITKLSLPALFDNTGKYAVLEAGAALGRGVGPLLIAKKMVQVPDVAHCTIGIPGVNTTAHFLLNFAFPNAVNKVPLLFSGIENAVLEGQVDMGVIIHENRFTYHQKGLIKILDLGEVWEQRMNLPIPLGCIAIRRDLPAEIAEKVNDLIRKSLEYSFANYPEVSAYIKEHAQEMDENVMRQHIELYVNDHSLALGDSGRHAIQQLYEVYAKTKEIDADAKLFA